MSRFLVTEKEIIKLSRNENHRGVENISDFKGLCFGTTDAKASLVLSKFFLGEKNVNVVVYELVGEL